MEIVATHTTLNEAINEAFRRKGRKAAAEAEKLRTWFENYYGGTGSGNVLNTPMAELYKDLSSFTASLEAGLRSFPNDKQAQAVRLSILLQYIADQYKWPLDLGFLQNFMCKTREERLLRILKYLHSGSRSRADISETFGISERTLSEDLNTLLKGFEFMGCTMKINDLERGSNTYSSCIHPLFLAMRTDEIFSLTVGLKLLSRGTVFEESLGHIADSIFKQLSPFAQAIINEHSEPNHIAYTDSEMKFINSNEYLVKQSRSKLPYYLKEPVPCGVFYNEAGNTKMVSGTLHLCNDGNQPFDRVLVKNEKEEVVIGINDVIGIKPVDKKQ